MMERRRGREGGAAERTWRGREGGSRSKWHGDHGASQDFTTFFFSNFPNE